jgi:DNA replicative helicase MCM subunit Mcm2 (Cdc46/Mcm family)
MAKKYFGKVVEISGVVVDMQRFPSEQVSRVYLGDTRVPCIMTDPQPWLKISHGAKVKIKGTLPAENEWTGTPGTLVLCEVVDPGIYKPLRFSADQLTKEQDEKVGLIEGEVAKIDAEKCELQLKAKMPVTCEFTALKFKDAVKKLKPGDKVEVYGQVKAGGDSGIHVDGQALNSK